MHRNKNSEENAVTHDVGSGEASGSCRASEGGECSGERDEDLGMVSSLIR